MSKDISRIYALLNQERLAHTSLPLKTLENSIRPEKLIFQSPLVFLFLIVRARYVAPFQLIIARGLKTRLLRRSLGYV